MQCSAKVLSDYINGINDKLTNKADKDLSKINHAYHISRLNLSLGQHNTCTFWANVIPIGTSLVI